MQFVLKKELKNICRLNDLLLQFFAYENTLIYNQSDKLYRIKTVFDMRKFDDNRCYSEYFKIKYVVISSD